MGAGPTKEQVRQAMRVASTNAVLYTEKTGDPCTPRYIQASNGEGAIVYDIVKDGAKITCLNLNDLDTEE